MLLVQVKRHTNIIILILKMKVRFRSKFNDIYYDDNDCIQFSNRHINRKIGDNKLRGTTIIFDKQ